MKKVSNKLQSLVNRMYKIQEELDELKMNLIISVESLKMMTKIDTKEKSPK